MAQVGTIKALSSGKFYLKDYSGNVKELNIGDAILENQIIFGDSSNSSSSKVEILLSSNDVVVLSQGQKQLIDSSLIETAFGTEELFFTRENLDKTLDSYNSNSDVVSDLRDAEFNSDVQKILEESAAGENQATGEDITEEETTEGKEEAEDTEQGAAEFAARDGNATDVNSDLREANFPRTQSYREVENNDRLLREGLKELGTNISNNYFNNPSFSTPTRPDSGGVRENNPIPTTPSPAVVTPTLPKEQLPLVNLSVDDVIVYETDGFLIFTVSIDQVTTQNISFNYKTSQNTATSGKDYIDVSSTITIPAGSTSVKIKVPVIDDYYSDNNETMKITISNPVGNAVIVKPEGIGTILDNPSANDKPLESDKPDSENGTYGKEDTVFAIITGSTVVNEGDKASYTVKLVDKDGNEVIVTKDTKVTVVYKNISTSNDDTEKNNNDEIEVIIKAGTSTSKSFTVQTNDDYLADNGEKYNLEIKDIETTGEFENIKIGDKNGKQKDVTTTILDNSVKDGIPTNPNENGKTETNQEQVILKIVACDTNGNPLFEADGKTYKLVNETNEGEVAKYMVIAFKPNTINFTSDTKLPDNLQGGTVTIKTTDDTAKGVTTQTKEDGTQDYKSEIAKTVIVGKVFEIETLDDYISDNGEKYKVSINENSYKHPITPIYENVKTDLNPVTTTILDNSNPKNGTPHEPNEPNNHTQEPDKEIIFIKLFAADKDGNVLKDVNGNYLEANRFAEGTEAKYIVYAFKDGETIFNDNTRLQTQTGTVDISFTNGTAMGSLTGNDTDTTGNKDFNNTSKSNISLGSPFGTDIFKDDTPEGKEYYIVTIDSNSYKGDYESVKIDPNLVTTTIYDKVDTIYAIIEGDISVNEGDKASYTVKFIDKYGNDVEVEADTKVKVKFNHNNTNPTQNDDTEYNDNDEFEITIKAGKSTSEPFTVQTNDDVYKDDGEKYKLTITNIENTHGYNTSNIGDKDGNKTNVVTVIKDNTNSGTETDIDEVKIILVALEKGQTLADITDSDGKLIYKNTNTTPESGKLYYVAVAVDSDDKVLVQSGQVTVNTANGTAIGHNNPTKIDGSEDYKSLTNKSINIGEVFEVETNDDYVRDNDEIFTVKITNVVNTNYETPSIDTSKDTVTSTITDNPAKVEQPDTGTGNDNPTTGNYGKDDTVYVKITKTPSTVEGGNLVHTITLVDKNGDPVTVPAGQTVTVNLTYSVNSGSFTESDLSTIVKQVVINGETNHTDFTNIAKDDFVYEGDEVYNVTILSVTQSGAFENVAIHTDKTTTGTIKDGVTIYKDDLYIDPANAYVDEDNFVITNSSSTITDTKSLNIIKPNIDNAYSLVFDNTIVVYKGDVDSTDTFDYGDSRGTTLQSGGVDIEYVVSGNTITGYKGTGRTDDDRVFKITLNKNSDISSGTITKDSYTYTQYKNIDHPIKGDATVPTNDDNITFEFGFKITDQGSTSEPVKFKVTVNDSLPKTTSWIEEVNEDGSKIIVISPESFAGGYIEIANGTMNGGEPVYYKLGKTASGDIVTKIDIYDPADLTKKVGELTTSGNGTVLFTPSEDYSNYDYTKNPSFSYKVSDFDGDTAGAKVEIKVKPVADAPTITFDTTKGTMSGNTFLVTTKEDHENFNEGTHKVDLGLKVPALSKDQIDKDSGKGDNPERNGEITLTFTNGDKVIGTKIFNGATEVATINSANQTVKVVIVTTSGGTNVDYTYHHKGTLPAKGGNVLYLTKAEYEALKIQHTEDNDTDILMNTKVTSYEVDDTNIPLSTVIYGSQIESTTTADMKVIIQPVTDNIELVFDTATNGTITQTDRANDTFTFSTPINEGSGAINLNSILSNTSGAIGSSHDLDGSEKRTYTISGIPEGTKVKIGDTEAIAGKDGKATLTFKDVENKAIDPEFTMEFPKTFGGGVKATIALSVYDKGADGTDTKGTTLTEKVYLNLDVEPVATTPNINTIQVSQAIGYEDDGRNIDGTVGDISKGIPLKIKVSSDDTDGSEKANVKITNIPAGAKLYYNGIEVTHNGSNEYIIEEFDNSANLTFVPPFNNDSDYTLKVSVQFVDTVTYNDNSTDTKTSAWSAEKNIGVIVKNVADAPVGTEIKDTLTATEDIVYNLKNIYNVEPTAANFKSSDDTEELTVKIKLKEGFTLDEGTPYYIDNGEYVVKASDIIADKVKIKFPEHFSGNSDIELTYVTTEKAGENDSKTWHTQTVNIFVNPIADDVNVAESSTIYEDGQDKNGNALNTKINLTPTLKDIGTTNGTETIEAVYISKATIDAMIAKGYTLFVNGANITDKTLETITPISGTNGQYYVLTLVEADQITVLNSTGHQIDGNFNLSVAYKVTDTNGTSFDTKIFGHTHTVNVLAVTDQPTLTVNEITGIDVTINDTNVTVNNDTSATFTVDVTTSSDDKDSSEKVQEIIISGVPQGVSVENAEYMGYSGSVHNGIWVIRGANLTDKDLDSNGASSNIKFIVNASASFDNRDIKITTYIKDEATSDTLVESDSKTIHIVQSYTPTGHGGNPPLFNLGTKPAIIFEDNDDKVDSTTDDVYNLGKSITVTNVGDGTAGHWAITITDFPEGTVVAGYDYSYVDTGKTYYVITGNTTTGNAADIETRLSNVIVTPPKDMNTGGDKDGQMTFSATIVTSDNGTFKDGTPINNHTNPITPVTDEMTVAVNVANTNEDTAAPLTITLSNPSDGTKTELIGNSLTIKITETWVDDSTGAGIKGTLTDSSGKYNIVDNGDGTYTITPKNSADNFKVDTPITGLVYTPATNRDGSVKVEVSVQNKEGNSITLTSKGETTIKVAPVIDMKPEVTVVTATGIEDKAITGIPLANAVKLNVSTTVSEDSSEKFTNIVLDKVPNGFTVWYMDSGTLKMATNIGQSGTGTFDLTPNITTDSEVHRNKWLIPVGSNGALPEIYINAPENWAGTFDFDAQFTLKEQNLTTTEKTVVAVTGQIAAVADGVTIDPTLTFGKAFSWIDLKLNANMQDVDGSETMSLKLTGLSENAQFRVEDETPFDTTKAVWDSIDSSWTISGIKYDEINKLQLQNDKAVDEVDVKAWTVETVVNGTDGNPLAGTVEESTKVDKSFKLDIKAVGGLLELDEGINLDFGKLGNDFALKGVNTIDLNVEGENKLENLSLDNILNLTNDSGELTIKGLEEDKVSFKNETDKTWSKNGTEIIDSKTFDIYTNSGNSDVKVKVEQNIQDGVTS